VGKFIPVEPKKWAEMVKAQAEVVRLKAEVEQLTRAGDAMEMTLQADFNGCPYEPTIVREAMIYWRNSKNAAKKGGQP
jgi:hypothetical protein